MILRDEQKTKDRLWALEIRDVWVMEKLGCKPVRQPLYLEGAEQT